MSKLTGKIRRTAAKISKGFFIGVGVYAAISLGALTANSLMPANERTAVLTGRMNNQPVLNAVRTAADLFFMYAPVVINENLHGSKVTYNLNATKEQVLETLADTEFRNIVLIGHGSNSSFWASDGDVTSYDVLCAGIERKPGRLIQYTCGRSYGGYPLGATILQDPGKWFHFNGVVSDIEVYAASIKNVFSSI